MRNLAVIPARGGSKRIPRKNIRDFLGKPILAYSIEAATESRLFEEVMVSTDDAEIAKLATQYHAKVPFFRSSKNADDQATIADVIIEVVTEYEKAGKTFDSICCILPTSPLIGSNRIVEAYEKFVAEKLDSVCPVVEFTYPILRALKMTEENKLQMIWPEYMRTRSQDLKPAYHDAGSFIWVKPLAVKREKTLFCKNGGAIVLPETEVQDIDSEADWRLAEMKYRMINHKGIQGEKDKISRYDQVGSMNLESDNYRITTLREQDIFNIKEWRNAQLDILRQKHELTDEEQLQYFHEVIKPTFTDPNPIQMLFSFLHKNECIGYGGITNIDWKSKRAELSFLLDPKRLTDHPVYEKEFSIFITLIKRMVFEGLHFNRIFTETYDIRPLHVDILEKNGFVFEGRMSRHVLIQGRFVDSIIHGFMKEYYVTK